MTTPPDGEPVQTSEESAPVPRPSRGRFGGALRAVVAVAAGAGLVYGASAANGAVSWTRASDVRHPTTTSAGARSQVVCPGPDRPGSPGAGYADQSVRVLTSLAPDRVLRRAADATGSVSGRRLPGTAGGTVSVASSPGQTDVADVRGGGAAQIIGRGSDSTGLVAMQSSHDDVKTARGLQLVQCQRATDDAWLLAGGSQPGRLARLVLTNPGDGPITVDARVVGASGVLSHKSLHDVVVPAGSRNVVVLGDLGDAGASPAVHVTTGGGLVHAAVVDRWMTGETRSGEALTGAADDPARTQVLPAVADVGRDPVVRVAVPGGDESIVRVRATDPSGKVVSDRVTTVQGHSTGAVRLKGLDEGVYSVRVTADEPVVAAASSRTSGSGTTDVTWMPSAPTIDTLTGFALPKPLRGGRDTLVLSAAGHAAKVSLVTTSRSGKERTRTLTVPADHPVTVSVTDDTSGWIAVRSGKIHAGVVSTASDDEGSLVAATALHPVRSSSGVTSAKPQHP